MRGVLLLYFVAFATVLFDQVCLTSAEPSPTASEPTASVSVSAESKLADEPSPSPSQSTEEPTTTTTTFTTTTAEMTTVTTTTVASTVTDSTPRIEEQDTSPTAGHSTNTRKPLYKPKSWNSTLVAVAGGSAAGAVVFAILAIIMYTMYRSKGSDTKKNMRR